MRYGAALSAALPALEIVSRNFCSRKVPVTTGKSILPTLPRLCSPRRTLWAASSALQGSAALLDQRPPRGGMAAVLDQSSREFTSAGEVPAAERPPMGALLAEKKVLRSAVRKRLRAMSEEQKAAEDDAIQRHVAASDWFKSSHRICAYISHRGLREVSTNQLVAAILSPEPEQALYVPLVLDRSCHMAMLRISSSAPPDVVANGMGILEPTPIAPSGEPRENLMDSEEPLDLLLMPGLAFDTRGGRLGRGGGYYDLFLQTYLDRAQSKGWKRPFLVALSYSVQVLEESVPMDASDIPIDALVTKDGVLNMPGGTSALRPGGQPEVL